MKRLCATLAIPLVFAACGGAQHGATTGAQTTTSPPSASAPASAPTATAENKAPAPAATPAPGPEMPTGPTEPPASAPASAPMVGGVPHPALPPMPAAWKDMNKQQRMEWMKTVVAPDMKALFQKQDAKTYADFSCVTCHGQKAKKGVFTMPNPALPKLHPADGFKQDMKAHPEMTKFMMTQVTPEMAYLLGVKPYDPATKQGFGCFNCHTHK